MLTANHARAIEHWRSRDSTIVPFMPESGHRANIVVKGPLMTPIEHRQSDIFSADRQCDDHVVVLELPRAYPHSP